ncbi:MAG: outer membrane protein assembly factor BamE [Candidatus Auribacterota bacterium]|nr:outer membrane protein assembly factor BamE [Candidatus Auribacterota bacterium]
MKKMKSIVLISISLIVIIFFGCATPKIGSPIATNNVQQIRSGYTTRDDILSLFGTPLRNVAGETGEIWVYRYLNGEGVSQELVISFNGDKVSVFSYR